MILKIIHTSVIWFLINSCPLSAHSQEIGTETETEPTTESSIFKTRHGIELLKRSKAAEIKSWMNMAEDPCNDFYNFACGNWKRINSAEVQNKLFSNKFEVIYTAMERRTEKFLTQPKDGNAIEDKIRDFYQSCQNVGSSKDFKSTLKAAFQDYGQFSFLKTRKVMEVAKKNFNWWSAVANIYNVYGLSFIISVKVDNHLDDHNRTMLFLERAENNAVRITKDMLKLFATLFLGGTDDEASQVANSLQMFEEALSAAGTDIRSGKSPKEYYTLYNITTLNDRYKNLFEAEAFLKIVLNITELPAQVYVSDTKYFDDMIKIFNNTNPNIVEDYILWSLVEEYITGILTCTSTANRYFGKYLQHTIYQQYRSKDYEKEIYGLWDELKGVFQNGLQTNRYYWMSNATMKNAIQKLNTTEFVLNTYDDENFEVFFRELQIDPTNFVANVQNILKRIEGMREDKLQRTPVSLNGLQRETFSPRYHDRRNNINFSVSNLQPFHIWYSDYPSAIKYAAWGSVMADEMLHAFDDYGRHFDGNGSANMWWDEKSLKEFRKRRECFQQQYANYTFEGHSLADSAVQRDNIADNGAVKIAYLAYQQWYGWYKRVDKDIYAKENFDTLPYNNRQLFFISYAQFWCEDINPELNDYYASEEMHGPSKFRIIGSLSNFPTFSEIFKCTNTSAMNPSKKCEIF